MITQLPSRQLTKLSPIPKLDRKNRFPVPLRDTRQISQQIASQASEHKAQIRGWICAKCSSNGRAGWPVGGKVFAAAEFSVFLETIARQSMFTPTSEDW